MLTNDSGLQHADGRSEQSLRPTVWVCIAVFNRVQYTRRCLELLKRQTWARVVPVVVDDGSSDGTSAMVTNEHPEAVLLRGDGSLYWTGAMHLGISHILAHAAADDFTLLLNDDLLFADDLIERLWKITVANPRSLVQAVESCVDDTDIIWQGGVKMNWWTAKHIRLNHHRRISEFPAGHLEPSDYLTGRGVMVAVEVFRTIGNYDASYKQYGDPEFARRAAKHGYALLVAYGVAVLSYDKGKNLNEAESYRISDLKRYYFGTLSSSSLWTRWKNATDMTESALQALVFYCCDVIRITWHFASRLKLRSTAAL